jgi:hypothetical protein
MTNSSVWSLVATASGWISARLVSRRSPSFSGTALRQIRRLIGQGVDRLEPLRSCRLHESFDDVCADPLPSPLGEHPDTREFTVLAVVGLVESCPAEPDPLVRLLVDRDDVVSGSERDVVQGHLLDSVE